MDRPGDLVSFGLGDREGWFAVPPGDVEALTGRPGRTMREPLGGVARLTVAQNAVLRIGAGRTAGASKRAARSRSQHPPERLDQILELISVAGLAGSRSAPPDARAGAQRAVGDLDLEAVAGGVEARTIASSSSRRKHLKPPVRSRTPTPSTARA